MSWDAGAGGDGWNAEPAGDAGDSWGEGGAVQEVTTSFEGSGGDDACRICKQTGHFARECPDKLEGNGLTGECYNCGQSGHNKADCLNERVERPFTGICKSCGVDGHPARKCPSIKCKLCDGAGHKAIDCKSRRVVNWDGVPEMSAEDAWASLIDAAKVKDLDVFRICLRAYARATLEEFSLPDVEKALRDDGMEVYLIAKQQEIKPHLTIIDPIGNPDREFVLSIQLFDKPRRAKLAQGWPENTEENYQRLASAGYVQDRGVPLCSNCGELGHIRKHCKQEQTERVSATPAIMCVNCKKEGHRARDCPEERFDPHACKNCKQSGHTARECPEPRSAETVECRKCNEIGHFSKDCPSVEARPPRTCRNCGSEDHIAKECDQPRSPDTITCRNCEKMGHFSRDCPEPKDWSKVKCSNCGEMGHTIKRCQKEPGSHDNGGTGVDAPAGGWGNAGGGANNTASSGWATTAAEEPTGEFAWGSSGAAVPGDSW